MRYLLLPLVLLPTVAFAEPDTRTACATACKVIVLTADEEKVLTGQNGILDTAAAARALDLGQLVSYFRTKIANAPAGDTPKAQDKPPVDAAPAGSSVDK